MWKTFRLLRWCLRHLDIWETSINLSGYCRSSPTDRTMCFDVLFHFVRIHSGIDFNKHGPHQNNILTMNVPFRFCLCLFTIFIIEIIFVYVISLNNSFASATAKKNADMKRAILVVVKESNKNQINWYQNVNKPKNGDNIFLCQCYQLYHVLAMWLPASVAWKSTDYCISSRFVQSISR